MNWLPCFIKRNQAWCLAGLVFAATWFGVQYAWPDYQSEPDYSDVATVLILGATGLAVVWYGAQTRIMAAETKRMATATALGANASIRPQLRITTEKEELPPNDDAQPAFLTKVTNVGLGPAFWVEKWVLPPGEKVLFRRRGGILQAVSDLRDFDILADYLPVDESQEIARSAQDPSDLFSPSKQRYVLCFQDLAQANHIGIYSYIDDAWRPSVVVLPYESDEPSYSPEASHEGT